MRDRRRDLYTGETGKMKKRTVLITAAFITGFIGIAGCGAGNTTSAETRMQYVMYVGTNDKDTNQHKYTEEEARKIVDEMCLKYFELYTLQEATGSWKDEKDNTTHEYTLVCYFDDADEATVYKVADELIEALNQNTILIEKAPVVLDYYSGGK